MPEHGRLVSVGKSVINHTPVWTWLPVYVVQGLRVKRSTPSLPEAEGTTGSIGPDNGERRMQLAVVGDSLAAGAGVDHHRDTVAGQLAAELAAAYDVPVDWQVHAHTGLTAGGVRLLCAELDLSQADVVLLSVGPNDSKNLHTLRRWRRELAALLDALLQSAPHADLVIVGAPPMDEFPALPEPLASVLGARAARVDAAAQGVLASRPRVHRVDFELPGDTDMFAADGFHPSAMGHRLLAHVAATALIGSSRTMDQSH